MEPQAFRFADIRQAIERTKKPRILTVIRLANRALKALGIAEPKIAVAGLNPLQHGWLLAKITALLAYIALGTIALNITLYLKIPKGFLPLQDTGQIWAFARGDDAFSYQLMEPKIQTYRQYVMAELFAESMLQRVGRTRGDDGGMNQRLRDFCRGSELQLLLPIGFPDRLDRCCSGLGRGW